MKQTYAGPIRPLIIDSSQKIHIMSSILGLDQNWCYKMVMSDVIMPNTQALRKVRQIITLRLGECSLRCP